MYYSSAVSLRLHVLLKLICNSYRAVRNWEALRYTARLPIARGVLIPSGTKPVDRGAVFLRNAGIQQHAT
jgi:hypothetical protein